MTKKFSNGFQNYQAALARTIREALYVAPPMTLTEWSEKNAVIPKLFAGSNFGRFEAKAYQKGIMDAMSDPHVRQVTLLKSARIGYNVMINNMIGYYIAHDPSAICFVHSRQEDADEYSRSTILPMLQDTPILLDLAGDLSVRNPKQRIAHRTFRNGSWIKFLGSNSPDNFRSITTRVMIYDEIDAYDREGVEGDVISLGRKRTVSEYNTKQILGSTPTNKGSSRIEEAYEASDKREYFVPCPHCKEMQTLEWEFLKWGPLDEKGERLKDEHGESIHDPTTAHFVCQHNACIIEEKYKGWMVDNGEWRAQKPFSGSAGFRIWSAYSDLPGVTWVEIVKEFVEAKGNPVLLQPFVNTTLGQSWEVPSQAIAWSDLQTRRNLGAFDINTIPDDVHVLTCGVDVQGNRLEVLIVGWGAKEESYLLYYDTLHGDPVQNHVWDRLTEVITDTYKRQDGRSLKIAMTCVDSGNGNHTERVYAYCDAVRRLNVYAVKGIRGDDSKPIWPRQLSKSKTKSYRWAIVGTHAAKSAIFDRLTIDRPGQGYIHISNSIDDGFLVSLTKEKRETRYRNGRPFTVFNNPDGARNEALDCFVYALAAFKGSKYTRKLAQLPSPVRDEPDQEAQAEPIIVVQETPVEEPVHEIISAKPKPKPQSQPRPVPRQPQRRLNPFTRNSGGWL